MIHVLSFGWDFLPSERFYVKVLCGKDEKSLERFASMFTGSFDSFSFDALEAMPVILRFILSS